MKRIIGTIVFALLLLGLMAGNGVFVGGSSDVMFMAGGEHDMTQDCHDGSCESMAVPTCGTHYLFAATDFDVMEALLPGTVTVFAAAFAVFALLLPRAAPAVIAIDGNQIAYKDYRQILTVQKRE